MESNEKLVKDVKVVLADLENMLGEVKGKTSKEISEVHTYLEEKLATTKKQLVQSERDLLIKKQVATEVTEDYVQNNPWKLIVIAAVIAFLIGYSI